MAENALTKVARIAAGSAMGATYKDKDGKQQVIKPTGDANYLDLSGVINNSGSSSDGGGTNPDHPSAGADYYAGSLADGEITERYLLYQRDESVDEDPSKPITATLLRDVGTKFNMAGDGATFFIHLVKTEMNKGTKGTVTDIPLNYDPNNVAKDGAFTTTAPYPFYIKSSDLATLKTLAIPIDGIGENISSKNFKAPQLNVTFNGDGTMTFESVTGYDNDGDTSGATGANYEVIVDLAATFSTQKAVAQLPTSIIYFNGSIDHGQDIALTGPSDFFENSMDGLEITLENYIHFGTERRLPITALGLKTIYRVSKEQLILGNKAYIPMDGMIDIVDVANISSLSGKNLPTETLQGLVHNEWRTGDVNQSYYRGYQDPTVSINKNSIKFNLQILMEGTANMAGSPLKWGTPIPYTWNILKVTPYKD